MPERDPTVAKKILKRLNILTGATAVLALALVGLVVYIAIQQSRTQAALCTFRSDLISRKAQSVTFLKSHPKGAFGFSPAQIKQGIDNYQRTINALDPIHCPPPPTP